MAGGFEQIKAWGGCCASLCGARSRGRKQKMHQTRQERAKTQREQDRHRQMQIYPPLQGSLLSVYAIFPLLQGCHSTPGLSYVKYGLATLHFCAWSWWCCGVLVLVPLCQHMLLTCCFTSGGARIGPLSSRCPDADSGRL